MFTYHKDPHSSGAAIIGEFIWGYITIKNTSSLPISAPFGSKVLHLATAALVVLRPIKHNRVAMTWGRVRASLVRVRRSLEPFPRVERRSCHAVNLLIDHFGHLPGRTVLRRGSCRACWFPRGRHLRLTRPPERTMPERTNGETGRRSVVMMVNDYSSPLHDCTSRVKRGRAAVQFVRPYLICRTLYTVQLYPGIPGYPGLLEFCEPPCAQHTTHSHPHTPHTHTIKRNTQQTSHKGTR